MSASFDLAVIGAGPAGAAAALGAARAGRTVALFEPQVEPPDKPCGEGILPAGVAALRSLGFGELLAQGVPLPRIRYVLASGREIDVPLPSEGCALERPVLAAALARALAAEPRVTRFARHVTSVRVQAGFELSSGAERWSARILVAADGLRGKGAAWLRSPGANSGRYGLRARAEAQADLRHVEVHLGRRSEVYLTPLPGGRINVAVLRDAIPGGPRSSASWLQEALEEHPRAARRLGRWITAPEGRALTHRHPRCVARDGAFLSGDATGGVDPVLGCGVSVALTTGLAAAEAAGRALTRGSGAPERWYARVVRRETSLRRGVAQALVFLAAHPRLQCGVARLFTAWPEGAAHLARQVGGAA